MYNLLRSKVSYFTESTYKDNFKLEDAISSTDVVAVRENNKPWRTCVSTKNIDKRRTKESCHAGVEATCPCFKQQ